MSWSLMTASSSVRMACRHGISKLAPVCMYWNLQPTDTSKQARHDRCSMLNVRTAEEDALGMGAGEGPVPERVPGWLQSSWGTAWCLPYHETQISLLRVSCAGQLSYKKMRIVCRSSSILYISPVAQPMKNMQGGQKPLELGLKNSRHKECKQGRPTAKPQPKAAPQGQDRPT